jgi:hypothetical protein
MLSKGAKSSVYRKASQQGSSTICESLSEQYYRTGHKI